MSNGNEKKRGLGLLAFLLGLAAGIAGALLLPSYLPDAPWSGSSVEGTVLDKERQPDRLLMRISTGEGLMLATFSQKQDDIDLLVQAGDRVKLRVPRFEPFVTDPAIEHVRRPDEEGEQASATKGAAAGKPARTSYVERMEAQLAEWDAEIARLRGLAEEAGDDAQARGREVVAELEEESRAARRRLNELKKATGNAWEELRTGAERAWAELEGDLEEASSEIGATEEEGEPRDDEVPAPPPDEEPGEGPPA